jgi:mono/diheme cytochrome c family protein
MNAPERSDQPHDHTPRGREQADPAEGAHGIPWYVAALFVCLVTWGCWYFYTFGGASFDAPGDRRDLAALDTKPVVASTGNTFDATQLFLANCAACHQANGMGLPGVFPPLVGSSWVKDNVNWPVKIVLRGLSGDIEVAGSKYSNAMPSFKQLSDDEIAAIVSYVRNQFADGAVGVDAARVKEIRAATEGHTEPWKGGAELLSAKD